MPLPSMKVIVVTDNNNDKDNYTDTDNDTCNGYTDHDNYNNNVDDVIDIIKNEFDFNDDGGSNDKKEVKSNNSNGHKKRKKNQITKFTTKKHNSDIEHREEVPMAITSSKYSLKRVLKNT